MRILYFLLFTSLCFSATAQNLGENIKQQFVNDWVRAKAYTNEYLDAMPSDKYNFRAEDSVRTFAEQMLHLAQANIGFVANATGSPRLFQGWILERSATAKTRDSVVYYVNVSYDFAINALKNMDPAKLQEIVKRGNFSYTGLAWILKGFEHQTHHRGQTTIYLRLSGIKPPTEKLF